MEYLGHFSERLQAMSERQAELTAAQFQMNALQESHLAELRGIRADLKSIVAELPRLRWAAYGALLISLATAAFVGWWWSQLMTVRFNVDTPTNVVR